MVTVLGMIPSTDIVAHCEKNSTSLHDLQLVFNAEKEKEIEQLELYFGLSNSTDPSALVGTWTKQNTSLIQMNSRERQYVLSMPAEGYHDGVKFKHYATYMLNGDTLLHSTEHVDVKKWSQHVHCVSHQNWLTKRFLFECLGIAALGSLLLFMLLFCATRRCRKSHRSDRQIQSFEEQQYEKVYDRAEEEDEFNVVTPVAAAPYKPSEHVKFATRRATDVRRGVLKTTRNKKPDLADVDLSVQDMEDEVV